MAFYSKWESSRDRGRRCVEASRVAHQLGFAIELGQARSVSHTPSRL